MKVIYKTEVLVIGGGPVGIFAAFQLSLLGLKALLIEASYELGGMCNQYKEKNIYDIPGYAKTSAGDLILNLVQQLEMFNVVRLLNCRAFKYYKTEDNHFLVHTSQGIIECQAIFLAIGSGSFQPNKPLINDLDLYKDKVLFSVQDKSIFKDKDILIVGGGDSALDWSLDLSNIARNILLVHRRDKFSAMESSVERAIQIKNIHFYTNQQLYKINSNFESIEIKHNLTESIQRIKVDYVLCFLGVVANLGELRKWDIEFNKNKVMVDKTTQQTQQENIYAIGDGCTYNNKLKLILMGFAEAATAAYHVYSKIKCKKLNFQYSTNLIK